MVDYSSLDLILCGLIFFNKAFFFFYWISFIFYLWLSILTSLFVNYSEIWLHGADSIFNHSWSTIDSKLGLSFGSNATSLWNKSINSGDILYFLSRFLKIFQNLSYFLFFKCWKFGSFIWSKGFMPITIVNKIAPIAKISTFLPWYFFLYTSGAR